MFPRLYAILDLDASGARSIPPLALLDAWLSAGVSLIQLRAKHLTFGPLLDLAAPMAERCRHAGATFIVNDRADVAALTGSGVHVGQDDLPVEAARAIVGASRVGISTHSMPQVEAALRTTADYIAIGPVFETATKREGVDPVIGLAGVTDAARLLSADGRPLVAIGGVTLDRAPRVFAAGASTVAVISDLLAPDWRTRAAEYVKRLAAV